MKEVKNKRPHYCMIPFTRNVLKRKIHRDMIRLMVARDGVKGQLTVTVNVYGISYEDDEIVLELPLPLLLPRAKNKTKQKPPT